MSKIADYLREHIVGEVSVNTALRRKFSTDSSIFEAAPQVIVYPRVVDDVRKIARFSWQLAERKKVIPITARGAGTDQTGAAIGEGIILVFPAHMNKILEIDTKKNTTSVQPGINFRTLQDALKTHSRFIPSFPGSVDYSTIGGAVANNSVGTRSVKYGTMRDYVTSTTTVLSNGELIETGRLSKRELSRKKGLTTLEGDIYRQLDGLISDNWELIQDIPEYVAHNNSGYALADVKKRDGSFDLTPLLVGSQGTLGMIVQADMSILPNNMERTLVVAGFNDISQVVGILPDLKKLDAAAIELINNEALSEISVQYPNHFKGLIDEPLPGMLLLVEFDDITRGAQSKKAKKLGKILKKVTEDFQVVSEYDEREELWKLRDAVALLVQSDDNAPALPIIADGAVPVENIQVFYEKLHSLLKKYELTPAIWGHIGEGNLSAHPVLDLAKVGGRQKALKILDEYNKLVVQLHGSISVSGNDGRLRAPFMTVQYGEEVVKLFEAVQKVFDPHGIMNPGVKFGTAVADQVKMLRQTYQESTPEHYLPV